MNEPLSGTENGHGLNINWMEVPHVAPERKWAGQVGHGLDGSGLETGWNWAGWHVARGWRKVGWAWAGHINWAGSGHVAPE